MVKVPPYLQAGNTIALVCPSGFMAIEKAQTCIDVLQQWGYKVKVGTTVGSQSTTYFSGTDEERLINFQQILDDDTVHAVLCARGGYGLSRIIDQISFKKFKKQPKWVIGFSDITVLLSHIYTNYDIATLHSPMAGAFNDGGYNNEFVQSLKQVLAGKHTKYECAVHEFNKKGEAVGELVGGNLAMLAHMVGTPSDIKTKGRILFLEDVGEYLYNIDRMMRQLKRSGKLDKLAGLIIGGFTDTKDTERPFGQNAYEIIREVVKEYDYPVCFGFPVSHDKENYALKVGVGYKLKVSKSKVTLEE
ncbi:LD-carboxypeptidase [Niastella vici]|uniref:LD-carboxypeptidase n=1 Tax=Niastella vici TaxID=1703345 RepID=A0A1V9FSS4_9BACT|nr:LD-carboxypeptidase [Niastella vici]OQP61392.1 LD-carboxypeptidase [Niastella vici]